MNDHERVLVLPEPMAHQQEVLLDPARFKVLICGRRWGKTDLGTIAACVGHGPNLERRGALYGAQIWWVAPTYPLADEVWGRLDYALREVVVKKHEVKRLLVFPGGGSIQVKSADNPDSLRGSGLDGVVKDEVKDQKKGVWKEAIRPALSDKKGWLLAMGTPGEATEDNLAYYLFRRAQDRRGWRAWQRPSSDNPIVTSGEIEDMRDELGSFVFAREVLAQFVTDGGGMFRREWFQFYDSTPDGVLVVEGETFRVDDMLRFMTADLAVSVKSWADYTVAVVFARAPDGRLFVLDLLRTKIEGPSIVPTLSRMLAKWSVPAQGGLWLEGAGPLVTLNAEARSRGLPVKEIPITKDKVTRAEPLTAAIERGRILFPRSASWLEDVLHELCAFPDPAFNDDVVDALSLSVAVAPPAVGRRRGPPPPPTRPIRTRY